MPTTTASEALAQAPTARGARGWACHPHLTHLLNPRSPARDLADAIHLLCHVHGCPPGLIALALDSGLGGSALAWLVETGDRFERERLYLVRLASAVGPLPSTPGAMETENALQAQQHALETLARSERAGCALGAVTALLAEWAALRPLLDHAAARAGLGCPTCSLPDAAAIEQVIADSAQDPGARRALAFGAEQLQLQHRGLLDLLQARAAGRGPD